MTVQLHCINVKLADPKEKNDINHGDIKQEVQPQFSRINMNIQTAAILAPTQ